MRFRIIKVTYGDGKVKFKIKCKEFLFWYTLQDFYNCTEYFDTYDQAFDKVKELALRAMSRTEVDIEIVYEGNGQV